MRLRTMFGFRWQRSEKDYSGGAHNACERSEPAWWHVMGYEGGPPVSLVQVERRFRRLVAQAHPDRGGDSEQMQRLIRARARARVQLSA